MSPRKLTKAESSIWCCPKSGNREEGVVCLSLLLLTTPSRQQSVASSLQEGESDAANL